MAVVSDVQEVLPLSPAQAGMLFHHIHGDAASGAYMAVLSCTLNGPLDETRLQDAMQIAVSRRDAYRSGFVWEGVKTPVQVVKKAAILPWTVCDWTEVEAHDVDAKLAALISGQRQTSFDLRNPPLMAATLLKLAPDRHVLVWTIHHMISDGWSTSVVFDDIRKLYSDPNAALPQTAQFRDYLQWLRKQDGGGSDVFWQAHLSGLETPCSLEVTPLEPATDPLHRQHTLTLQEEILAGSKALAKELEVTPNTVFSTIWALVLRRWSCTDDVVFGQASAARPAEVRGISEAAGAFVNTLPVRLKIDGQETLRALFKRAELVQRQMAAHNHEALSEVQKFAGQRSGTPLFDCVFASQPLGVQGTQMGSVQITDLQTVQSSNYAMTLLVSAAAHLKLELHYDPKRVDSKQAEVCLQEYVTLLQSVLADPKGTVNGLLADVDGPAPRLPTSEPPDVVAQFIVHARLSPDAKAVSDMSETLSYGALYHRACALAQELTQMGLRPDEIVPVATSRGVQTLVGFLGVMMAGGAYVPMDISYPDDRLTQMIHLVRPRFIVSIPDDAVHLPAHDSIVVALRGQTSERYTYEARKGALAYVMFTSGSQGKPKAVEITHAALAHSNAARLSAYDETPGVYILLSSFAFDSSVAGIYWTLCSGGHLVIAPFRAEQDPAQLGDLIQQHQISHTLCLPSLYETLIGSVDHAQLTSLRTVVAAGEALPARLPAQHRKALPSARLFNEYGPTEATVWCSFYDATDHAQSQPVPIGHAIAGVQVDICDVDGHPAPAGVTGEIVITGPTVAQGYLGQPRDSKPFGVSQCGQDRRYHTGDLGYVNAEGGILFLGRRDSQIKIRGHRIELAEIEAAARSVLPDTSIVATAYGDGGSVRLVLCIEAKRSDDVQSQMQRGLARVLPSFAQPSEIAFVDAVPRLPNGKVDQSTLQKVIETNGAANTAENGDKSDLERQLAEIWQEVLQLGDVSTQDNFFDIGGDSLKSISVYSKARQAGIPVSPTDLFDHPTLSQLAAHVIANAGQDVPAQDRKLRLANSEGDKAPVILLHANMAVFQNVSRGLGPRHPVGVLFSNHLFGAPAPMHETVENLARTALEALKDIEHSGPYVLCGYSAGAPVAIELARLLGPDRVAFVCLVDPPYRLLSAEADDALQPEQRILARQHRRLLKLRMMRHALRVMYHRTAMRFSRDAERHRLGLVTSSYVFAMGRYRIQPYVGPVHILTTDQNSALDAGGVWARSLPDATVENMPFAHTDLLYDNEGVLAFAGRLVQQVRKRKL